jgi:hypothetical protein
MRPLALLTVALLLCVGSARAEPPAPEAVEAILSRALIERAAFRACASHEKDTETETMLTRSWRLDLAETWDVLRQAGYPEGDVRALVDRLDLDKMTPQFPTAEGLAAYCAALGDWKKRWALLMIVLPQLELRKLFKH